MTSAGGCFPASPDSTRWCSSSKRTTWSGLSSSSPPTPYPGVFNVAGEGKLPWSEVASFGGAHLLPLPPLRPRLFAAPLERLGTIRFPPEMESLARYGRGVDTSKLREAGFDYRYSSAGAVVSFARANNLRRATGGSNAPEYRYEQDVEQFFRHSPAVVRGIDT